MTAVAAPASLAVPARARPSLWSRAATGAFHVADVAIVGAVALWLLALRSIDTTALNDYGLVAALPVAYFVAIAIALCGFALELARPTPSPVRLGILVAALVFVLHGTAPALFPLPRYSWVYKHLGVVRLFMENGSLSDGADLYQSWPGFFAAGAWLSSIAGVRDPTPIVAWAQVVFNLVVCGQLLWLVRVLGASVRVQWTAVLLFLLGNWVSQDYFAPQALAYSLALAVLTMVFVAFRSGGVARWVSSLEAWVGTRVLRGTARCPAEVVEVPAEGGPGTGRGWPLVLLLGLFTAIVVSHPLTPYMVIASVGLMTVMGAVRPRWLVLVLVVETVVYMVPRYDFVASNYGIFHAIGNFFTNAQNNALTDAGLPGRLATAAAARYLSLGVWSLAALGVVSRLRRGAPALVYAGLVAAPVVLLLGQDYGGEAIFRVYLFALPWSAFLGADLLMRLRDRRPLVGGAVALAATLAMAGLFLQAYFGGESVNRAWESDVAAATYFYDHAPEGSILVLAAPNFPTRNSANYDRFLMYDAASDPNLMGEPALRGRMLDRSVLPRIESSLRAQVGESRSAYLVIGEGQRAYVDTYRLLPEGSLDALDSALDASRRWRTFYRSGGTVIYELADGGRR